MGFSYARASGFTLVELLVVIGIIAALAAILFPVFFQARGKARETACVANLRQIGLAMGMYAGDYDGVFPYGCDPVDKNTALWDRSKYAAQVAAMPLLSEVLNPYKKSHDLWRCPSDTGFDFVEFLGNGREVALPARPTFFEKYGMSYIYRTELALKSKRWGTIGGFLSTETNQTGTHGPAEVCVLFDGHGGWHGTGGLPGQKRYDVLMGDGHAKNLSHDAFRTSWNLTLSKD